MGCLLVVVVFAVLGAVGSYVFLSDVARRIQPTDEMDPAISAALESEESVVRGDPFYMVILGVDNREGETVARSDTLIVVRVDPPAQSATLVSIPRDTRVQIPGHGKQKINAAMALGGPALVIETVEEFTGLPITHYAEIDFNGFKEIVDALDGVTVNVPEKIQDPKAGNYDPEAYTIYPGEQRLTGAQALTFVRSREFPDGDLTRIKNQQIFIKALLKQSLQFSNTLRLPALVNAVADNITTDMSLTELLSLANDMKAMDDESLMTASMPGEPQYIGGVAYVIVDEDAFATLIDRVSQGLSPEPDPDEESVSLVPSEVSVTVRNGAGIEGVASDAASRLTAAGYGVGEVGNANQFVYDETLIVYTEDAVQASAVKDSLGFGRVVASRGMYAFDTDILVVVGKDWESLTGAR
ncbi:MAG: LCP family protein [Coriobacteriia bacterium]|nr:LCP family protein [Coriobacteriia bacterium]